MADDSETKQLDPVQWFMVQYPPLRPGLCGVGNRGTGTRHQEYSAGDLAPAQAMTQPGPKLEPATSK